MSDSIQELYDKIDKNFPDHIQKCELICTLLGTSATLTEFVMEKIPTALIPLNVQYSILITSVNMLGMISDGVIFEKVDMTQDYKISEQSQEHIYRKMKKAIEIIVEEFKKHEEEYDI